MMKKLTLTLLMLFMGFSMAIAVPQRGPQNIANTIHNFSTSSDSAYASFEFDANAEDQICVYCHTPHGGSLDGPLWNRDYAKDATGYTFYTSDTLTAEAAGVGQVSAESLLCLSCHDGTVSVGDDLINTTGLNPPDNSVGAVVQTEITEPGPRIGASRASIGATNDLSDDHPISFNYVLAQGADNSLRNIDDALGPKALGMRFYGAGQNYLECGTCHDPHVDYKAAGNEEYAPFLAVPNTDSQMCLACHIK